MADELATRGDPVVQGLSRAWLPSAQLGDDRVVIEPDDLPAVQAVPELEDVQDAEPDARHQDARGPEIWPRDEGTSRWLYVVLRRHLAKIWVAHYWLSSARHKRRCDLVFNSLLKPCEGVSSCAHCLFVWGFCWG